MIGVIVAASPAENLNFVLPMREVLEAPAGRGRVDSRIPYQLPVMPFGVNETMRFNIELPLGPGEFGRKLEQESNAHSDRLRAKLLAEHAERLFPRGDKSVRMMHSYYPGWMPRLIRYGDDGEWSPRETSGETEASLPHGGKVTAGLIANTALIRVTSLGAAVRDDKHVDAYGRTWQLRSWRLDAMDLKVVALLLPVPNGYVALVRFIPEGRAHDNSEELKILANLIYPTYVGTMTEWQEFAKLGDLRPKVFDGIRIGYTANQQFSYRSSRFELSLEPGLIDISDRSRLQLDLAYFPERGGIVWDVSALRFLEDLETSISVYVRRRARIPAEIGGNLHRDWNRMLRREAPFDGQPLLDEEYPRVRTVFGLPKPGAAISAVEPERLYEVGLTVSAFPSVESVQEMQEQLFAKFKLLE